MEHEALAIARGSEKSGKRGRASQSQRGGGPLAWRGTGAQAVVDDGAMGLWVLDVAHPEVRVVLQTKSGARVELDGDKITVKTSGSITLKGSQINEN